MSIGTLVTLIAAVVGSGGLTAILTAYVNSKRNKSQSETEARAQNTEEFRAIKEAMNEQMNRMQEQLNAADRRAEKQDEKIASMDRKISLVRAEHHAAEDYIDLLMAGIYNGTIPPIPPRHKD